MTPTQAYNAALPEYSKAQALKTCEQETLKAEQKAAEAQAAIDKATALQKEVDAIIAEIDGRIETLAPEGHMSILYNLGEKDHTFKNDIKELLPKYIMAAEHFTQLGFNVSLDYDETEHQLSGNDPDYGSGTILTKIYNKLEISWNKPE